LEKIRENREKFGENRKIRENREKIGQKSGKLEKIREIEKIRRKLGENREKFVENRENLGKFWRGKKRKFGESKKN